MIVANGLSEKVVLLRGRTVALPAGVEKVDVIVSVDGYALRKVPPSVLFADRHLAAGGAMLPSSCTMLERVPAHKLALDDVRPTTPTSPTSTGRRRPSARAAGDAAVGAGALVVDDEHAADAELDFTAVRARGDG